MSKKTSLILKSEAELKQALPSTGNTLAKMSLLAFWKAYFARHKYRFNKNKFDWEAFQQIPFSSKKALAKLGVKKRLTDTEKILKENPFGVVLMSTSGTTTQGKPLLLVKSGRLDREGIGELLRINRRTLNLFQPRTLSLRVLCSFLGQNGHDVKRNQILFVNPFRFKDEMAEAVCQMNAAFIMSFPASVTYLSSAFPKAKKIFSISKKIWFGGDFLAQKQAVSIADLYPHLEINQDYMMGELDLVGSGCKFIRKRHGLNIYHPSDNRIIELVNIDKEGVGELVVSKLDPFEMGYIRYKTGDLAKAVKETCLCGKGWMFSLVGRSNMDYIKTVGALVSRTEIEKALKNFDNLIEEWRGEVREVPYNGSFLGQLKLILKPYNSVNREKIDINRLESSISTNILLTPKKTLAVLVKENRFMPLKIELVDRFPQTVKKVLLRKVLD